MKNKKLRKKLLVTLTLLEFDIWRNTIIAPRYGTHVTGFHPPAAVSAYFASIKRLQTNK